MLLPLLICVQRNLPKFGSLLKNVFRNSRKFQRKFTTSSCARLSGRRSPRPALALLERMRRHAPDHDGVDALPPQGRRVQVCAVQGLDEWGVDRLINNFLNLYLCVF